MRILIAAIGKARNGPFSDLTDDYIFRCSKLAPNLGFNPVTLIECEAPKNLSGKPRADAEAALLLKASDQSIRIALDEKGRNMTTKEFSALLARLRDDGNKSTAFLIGGADGHGDALRDKVDHKISFGAATWPHMLVRAMLAEQLYRTMTLLAGHPYHRA